MCREENIASGHIKNQLSYKDKQKKGLSLRKFLLLKNEKQTMTRDIWCTTAPYSRRIA